MLVSFGRLWDHPDSFCGRDWGGNEGEACDCPGKQKRTVQYGQHPPKEIPPLREVDRLTLYSDALCYTLILRASLTAKLVRKLIKLVPLEIVLRDVYESLTAKLAPKVVFEVSTSEFDGQTRS